MMMHQNCVQLKPSLAPQIDFVEDWIARRNRRSCPKTSKRNTKKGSWRYNCVWPAYEKEDYVPRETLAT